MKEKQINRLIRIKTIGWTTMVVFGLLTLMIFIQIIGSMVIANSFDSIISQQEEFNEITKEMGGIKNRVMAISMMACAITLLTTIGSIGLIKLKNWGIIIYQSFTIVIAVFCLIGLASYLYYVLYQINQPYHQEFDISMANSIRTTQNYVTLSYGIFLLLVSWILTRVNIFLSKKDVRLIFR